MTPTAIPTEQIYFLPDEVVIERIITARQPETESEHVAPDGEQRVILQQWDCQAHMDEMVSPSQFGLSRLVLRTTNGD